MQTELDFPVCKSGYRPYDPVTGLSLYGCPRHHPQRMERLIKAEWRLREGWARFDQWEENSDDEEEEEGTSESESEEEDRDEQRSEGETAAGQVRGAH